MAGWSEVSRDDLLTWADANGARDLPILVRRMILESGSGVQLVDVPGGSGVQLGGHDGFVRSTTGNAFVPEGVSVWELSVNKKSNAKANDDFGKRSSVPDDSPPAEAVYIQMICRPWAGAAKWAASKSSDRLWKEVRAYNVDRVATWLEQAPSTRLWFLEQIGRPIVGVTTASRWWEAWSTATNPVLTPGAILVRGTNSALEVSALLLRRGLVTLGGEIGANELVACAVAASIGKTPLERPLLVVEERVALSRLLLEVGSLVLVLEDPALAEGIPEDTHHTVVVPLPLTDKADVVVGKLDSGAFASSLRALGFPDADENGRLGRRSLVTLRRRYAAHHMQLPGWGHGAPDKAVRAAVLITSWDDSTPGDRKLFEDMTDRSYPDLREALLPLSVGTDPMLVRSGTRWQLVSTLDAWTLLAKHLLVDDVQAFARGAVQVLGQPDPFFGVSGVDRMVAQVRGTDYGHSRALRKGVASGLARLGALGDLLVGIPGGGNSLARYAIRELVSLANGDRTGSVWSTLSELLPSLIEAAPNDLLNGIGQGLSGDDPVLATIFQDGSADALFGGPATHTHLLAALERAAWSQAHIGEACRLLARLSQVDPGGTFGNRPPSSLVNVLCLWYRGTSASTAERLAVLDMLRTRFPDEAWELLKSLVDRPGGSLPDAAPEYRSWAPPRREEVPRAEYDLMLGEIANRIITDAGSVAHRWGDVLEYLGSMPAANRRSAISAMKNVEFIANPSDPLSLWKRMREYVARHREFPEAGWSLGEDDLADLTEALRRLTPSDPVERYSWLFVDRVDLGDFPRRDDYLAYDLEVERRRASAVREILSAEGLSGIERLGKAAATALVGVSLADECQDEFLAQVLTLDREPFETFGRSYLWRRARVSGIAWARSVLATNPELSATLRAQLLHDTYDFEGVSMALANESDGVRKAHWELFNWWGRGHDFPHGLTAAKELVAVGRWATAVQMLTAFDYSERATEAAELAATALELVLYEDSATEPVNRLSRWELERVLKLLDVAADSIGVERVVRIQWLFVRAIDEEDPSSTIHRYLAKSSSFFVGLVCEIYRPRLESEPEAELGEKTEGSRSGEFGANALHLLRCWSTPPGLSGDGTFDRNVFLTWYREVTVALDENGLGDEAREIVGQVLSYLVTKGVEWPTSSTSELIELLDDDRIDRGISLRMFNRGNVTSRGMDDGGEQELEIAKDFRSRASGAALLYPRVSRLLAGLADTYEWWASREDAEAERHRLGLH